MPSCGAGEDFTILRPDRVSLDQYWGGRTTGTRLTTEQVAHPVPHCGRHLSVLEVLLCLSLETLPLDLLVVSPTRSRISLALLRALVLKHSIFPSSADSHLLLFPASVGLVASRSNF